MSDLKIIMSKRNWIRNFIHQALILLLFLVGLFYLRKTIVGTPELAEIGWLTTLFWFTVAVYIVQLVLFIRSSFFGYVLERFDPGNVESLKRLADMKKFHLSPEQSLAAGEADNPVAAAIVWLESLGYIEAGRRTMGLVFERPAARILPWGKDKLDRVFLLYLPMPNVLIVDRLLRECIAYIGQQWETRPAPVNHLFLLTDMDNKDEVTSAASGVVNFLLKIDEGSLCPWLFDLAFGRLFYPLDRSLISGLHRRQQNKFRSSLLNWLAKASNVDRSAEIAFAPGPLDNPAPTGQTPAIVRTPKILTGQIDPALIADAEESNSPGSDTKNSTGANNPN